MWIPTSYTLIVEHRTCTTCKSTHDAPAKEILVELLSNLHGGTLLIKKSQKTISIQRLMEWLDPFPLPTLPRTIKHIDTTVQMCPGCFFETSPDQLDFWPRRPPVVLTTASIEAQRRQDTEPTIEPAELDDIP